MTGTVLAPEDALTASRAGAPGRVLEFITVKRLNPRFRRTYGHWWIEVDGVESYGWWPSRCPIGLRGLFVDLDGRLNGLGVVEGGTPTTDPHHRDVGDHCFHPTLTISKRDDEVREEIRAFAHAYSDVWRWRWWWQRKPTRNCRTFQDDLFAAIGLFEGEENLYTRGPGCPFMYPLRRLVWAVSDARDWAKASIASRHLGRRGRGGR